jgi:hypothetical protein
MFIHEPFPRERKGIQFGYVQTKEDSKHSSHLWWSTQHRGSLGKAGKRSTGIYQSLLCPNT